MTSSPLMKPHTERPASTTPNQMNEFFQRAGAFATALLTKDQDTCGLDGYVEGRVFGLVFGLGLLVIALITRRLGERAGMTVSVTRRIDQVNRRRLNAVDRLERPHIRGFGRFRAVYYTRISRF